MLIIIREIEIIFASGICPLMRKKIFICINSIKSSMSCLKHWKSVTTTLHVRDVKVEDDRVHGPVLAMLKK